jgi:TetR/AcrR family transcriptional regulator, fatty acid metabolism regulator protein
MPRPRPGKRKEQATATRKKIYDVSIRLIEKHGFENVTVESICHAAGVAVGSFYTHFPSKAGIIEEIYRQGDEYFENVVAKSITASDAPTRILAFFHHYAEFNARNGIEFVRLLYRGMSPRFSDRTRAMVRLLYNYIEAGQASGEIVVHTSSDDIVYGLFSFARGIIFDWCVNEGKYDLIQSMDLHLPMLLRSFTS